MRHYQMLRVIFRVTRELYACSVLMITLPNRKSAILYNCIDNKSLLDKRKEAFVNLNQLAKRIV